MSNFNSFRHRFQLCNNCLRAAFKGRFTDLCLQQKIGAILNCSEIAEIKPRTFNIMAQAVFIFRRAHRQIPSEFPLKGAPSSEKRL